MSVTADSTLWTADTICVTADGRVICIDAVMAEPVRLSVTTDTTLYTADNATWPTADGGTVGATDEFHTVADVTAGYVLTGYPVTFVETPVAATAGYVLTGASAEFRITEPTAGYVLTGFDVSFVIEPVAQPGVVGGGAHYPRRQPFPVVGHGFGILPELWGEAHGVVGVVGAGAGTLPGLTGEATGAAGVAGRSEAKLLVRATATGARGTRGSGAGTIVKFSGSATGHQDDDEAVAVIAFLLAA